MDYKSLYFDSNVVLDILNNQRKNHLDAKSLLKYCINNNIKITISEDMLSTIFYINRDNKLTLEFFKFIENRWEIVPFGKKVVNSAINLSLEKNLDLEDLLQCLCAKNNGCEALITNDKRFYDCGIKILTINEFLNV